ncbi:MAG: nickel transporter [Bradyrhizobiaceae bacterium]|nr:nickel transporter [Hyphomicrobiales bacterium]MBV9426580.1 nickel transporter [Bradyrhizobiaceae bacterium]
MEIIPVIDLRGGVVVHARMGRRDEYRPIKTNLARTSDPVDIVRGLFSIYRFPTLYVADLDAIEGSGDNRAALERLKAAFPELTLWVDSGVARPAEAERWLAAGMAHLVLGSESQADTALVRRFAADPRVVLSLDFRGAAFQGPSELLADTDCWPGKVIAMTLAKVGSGAGPDIDLLGAVRKTAGTRMIYAAGGVRDAVDLIALARAGIAGALVASCLHDGRLTGAEIAKAYAANGCLT